MVAGESGEAGNPGTLGMTNKERVAERRGPLPRARAVVGAVATSISSRFCGKRKKVTNSRDDKQGEGRLQGKGGC